MDVLVNNAGTWETVFSRTTDGIETNLQVNHLGPMLLTLELLPALEMSDHVRIVNTSSMAHRRDIYDLSDPEWIRKPYDGIATCSQPKLFNLLFSLHLAKLLAGKSITVNTVHPAFPGRYFPGIDEFLFSPIPGFDVMVRSMHHVRLSL